MTGRNKAPHPARLTQEELRELVANAPALKEIFSKLWRGILEEKRVKLFQPPRVTEEEFEEILANSFTLQQIAKGAKQKGIDDEHVKDFIESRGFLRREMAAWPLERPAYHHVPSGSHWDEQLDDYLLFYRAKERRKREMREDPEGYAKRKELKQKIQKTSRWEINLTDKEFAEILGRSLFLSNVAKEMKKRGFKDKDIREFILTSSLLTREMGEINLGPELGKSRNWHWTELLDLHEMKSLDHEQAKQEDPEGYARKVANWEQLHKENRERVLGHRKKTP